MKKIAIVGGGAAGLFAAAYLSTYKNYDITIFEKNNRVGKKLLLTGNGKCNITNTNISDYCFNDNNFYNMLKYFSNNDTIDFFNSIGLLTKTDSEGRVYPYSESSNTVVNVLLSQLIKNKVSIICDCEILSIMNNNKSFNLIDSLNRNYEADVVILASGGKTYYKMTNSYDLATNLNHTISKLSPSLVGLKTQENLSMIQNIRFKANVRLFVDNNCVYQDSGELFFKKDGLSGIVMFQITSILNRYTHYKKAKVLVDLMPEYSFDTLNRMFKSKKCDFNNLLDGIFPKPISQYIYKSLKSTSIDDLVNLIKSLPFNIVEPYSFENAQVTSGGVLLDEIDHKTMMSKKHNDLYIIGELLNLDGLCGGYNLQIAWTTAALCANSIRKDS